MKRKIGIIDQQAIEISLIIHHGIDRISDIGRDHLIGRDFHSSGIAFCIIITNGNRFHRLAGLGNCHRAQRVGSHADKIIVTYNNICVVSRSTPVSLVIVAVKAQFFLAGTKNNYDCDG